MNESEDTAEETVEIEARNVFLEGETKIILLDNNLYCCPRWLRPGKASFLMLRIQFCFMLIIFCSLWSRHLHMSNTCRCTLGEITLRMV